MVFMVGCPSDPEHLAKMALREALTYAHNHLYRTDGQAWREIIASLGFETSVDLSLIRNFGEQDQARFQVITQAFASRQIDITDIIDIYLEFFPRPAQFKLGEGGYDD